jgi:hypothetical protein
MNTEQIDRILKRNIDYFDGVFSCDRLPDRPRLLVSNTDPANRPGQHWIAIFVDCDGRGEYFDSFGCEPSDIFRRYMNRYCVNWTYNHRQLQSVVSRFCGHYCVYYCLLRSRGLDMCKIVSSFTNDTGFNDIMVHEFVCNKRY